MGATRAVLTVRMAGGATAYFNSEKLALQYLEKMAVCGAAGESCSDSEVADRAMTITAALEAHKSLDEVNQMHSHNLGCALHRARGAIPPSMATALRRLQRLANEARHAAYSGVEHQASDVESRIRALEVSLGCLWSTVSAPSKSSLAPERFDISFMESTAGSVGAEDSGAGDHVDCWALRGNDAPEFLNVIVDGVDARSASSGPVPATACGHRAGLSCSVLVSASDVVDASKGSGDGARGSGVSADVSAVGAPNGCDDGIGASADASVGCDDGAHGVGVSAVDSSKLVRR